MNDYNPEKGEALVGAFEIMAERLTQVAESVRWIEHVVEQMPETTEETTQSKTDYTLAA